MRYKINLLPYSLMMTDAPVTNADVVRTKSERSFNVVLTSQDAICQSYTARACNNRHREFLIFIIKSL